MEDQCGETAACQIGIEFRNLFAIVVGDELPLLKFDRFNLYELRATGKSACDSKSDFDATDKPVAFCVFGVATLCGFGVGIGSPKRHPRAMQGAPKRHARESQGLICGSALFALEMKK